MKRISLFASLIGFALIIAINVSAQSGRKQKKTENQPPPQGVNQPETRVIPEPTGVSDNQQKSKEKQISVMVASDLVDAFSSGYYIDYARQGCIAQLRDESRTLDIREARDTNRAQAAKRAKEDEVFVIHLELRSNGMQSSSASSSFDLMFTVYQPKTGKIAGSGSGYPGQGGARMPIPAGGYGYDQRALELMGRDAANKALKIIREKGTSPLVATR